MRKNYVALYVLNVCGQCVCDLNEKNLFLENVDLSDGPLQTI